MSRGRSGFTSFIAFLAVSVLLSLIFGWVINSIWLARSGIIRADINYYAVYTLIVFVCVLFFSNISFFARPVAIGFIAALLQSVYLMSYLSISSAVLVFIGTWIAVTFGTGIADGLIRGYGLKGVRI